MEQEYCLIGPILQLVTLSDLPERAALKDELLRPIAQAGILILGDLIFKTGLYADLVSEANTLNARFVTLEGDYVCLPGFIDAHTHICFAGSRANDYAMRNSGKTYMDISLAGGGIWDTVQQTRSMGLEELAELTVERAQRHLSEGVTTIEVKSGYGLSVEEEIKILRAIQLANKQTEADLIPTCLAAHTLPKDFTGTHSDYLEEMSTQLFPILQQEKLCTRVDAFIEQGAFSSEVIRPYFIKAQQFGFTITVHADQFSTGGSAVAVEFKAVTADHLEASGDIEIELLAASNVIAVALPGASIGLGCAFAPARKILDTGSGLVIASDWNPGSAPMGDLLAQAALLGTFEKLSNAEVIAGITCRAAHALNLHDRGQLSPGFLADFNLFATSDYKEILYQQGKLKPAQVWKNGSCAFISI